MRFICSFLILFCVLLTPLSFAGESLDLAHPRTRWELPLESQLAPGEYDNPPISWSQVLQRVDPDWEMILFPFAGRLRTQDFAGRKRLIAALSDTLSMVPERAIRKVVADGLNIHSVTAIFRSEHSPHDLYGVSCRSEEKSDLCILPSRHSRAVWYPLGELTLEEKIDSRGRFMLHLSSGVIRTYLHSDELPGHVKKLSQFLGFGLKETYALNTHFSGVLWPTGTSSLYEFQGDMLAGFPEEPLDSPLGACMGKAFNISKKAEAWFRGF